MPNDHPETLADICARIRTIDESMMRDLDFIAVFLEFLPRDIEAAAEREQQDAMKTALLAKCKVCEKVGPASAPGNASALREALVEILDRTNLEKERDYKAALHAGILEIHDIANTTINQIKGE